jgi:hypothetical protein
MEVLISNGMPSFLKHSNEPSVVCKPSTKKSIKCSLLAMPQMDLVEQDAKELRVERV